MLKKLFTVAITLFSFPCFAANPLEEPVENITFEYLAANEWTSHVYFFKKIFETLPIHNFLEFGTGNSTKYFLDHCDRVTSVELNADCCREQTQGWFDGTVAKFLPVYPNWNPHLIDCSSVINKLTQIAWKGISPERIPSSYFKEIHSIASFGIKSAGGNPDFVFVDSALFGRGDIVNDLLARKLPIVAAHDTNLAPYFYRWDKIVTPKDYILIQFNRVGANQLSVWFHQDFVQANPQVLSLQSTTFD